MKLFRVLFTANLGIAAAICFIFLVGLVDSMSARHVDREDLLLWPFLIVGIGFILGGGWWLGSRGRWWAANGVLLLMTIPGLMAALALMYLLIEMSRPGTWR